MEAFTISSHGSFRRLPTSQSASTTTPGPDTSIAPPPAPPPQSQSLLQQRLQTLIEGARERWTYAIFWQAYGYSSGASRLRWGHGYYKGEDDKAHKTTSSGEQNHRKKVLREIYSLISADVVDEEVTDTSWFFLLSMTQSFANGSSLPGLAFFNWRPVWVTGPGRLSKLACERALQGQVLGLQTLVCIPCANGVVELASTEVILPNPDLMNGVLDLFDADFKNNKVREGIKDMADFIYPIGLPGLLVVDEHHAPLQPREESHESAVNEMQNHGKEKLSDSKCSWPLLTESSDRGTDRTLSNSHDYSGPS